MPMTWTSISQGGTITQAAIDNYRSNLDTAFDRVCNQFHSTHNTGRYSSTTGTGFSTHNGNVFSNVQQVANLGVLTQNNSSQNANNLSGYNSSYDAGILTGYSTKHTTVQSAHNQTVDSTQNAALYSAKDSTVNSLRYTTVYGSDLHGNRYTYNNQIFEATISGQCGTNDGTVCSGHFIHLN